MPTLTKALFLGTALFAATAIADDVSNAKRLLCATQSVSVCTATGACVKVLPEDLNIPLFIEIDVKAKTLATTEASGENRSTKIQSVSRENGKLVMQGVEADRAYSLLIEEATGWASFASVADERSVVAFAACTTD